MTLPSNQSATPQDHGEFWDNFPLLSTFREIKSFFATRQAILAGKAIYDFPKAELKASDLMNPWKFNIFQSVIAAGPSLLITSLASYFFPNKDDPTWTGTTAVIVPWIVKAHATLEGLTVPFSLLLAVFVVSWASLHRKDRTRSNRYRIGRIYLYLDGAFGLYSQAFGALFYTTWLMLERTPLDDALKYPLAGLFFVCAALTTLWQGWITLRTIPSRTFSAQGYSAEIGGTDTAEEGPWGKYRLTVAFLLPVIGYLFKGVLWAIAGVIGLLLAVPSLSRMTGE
jgi:hypothetical protein